MFVDFLVTIWPLNLANFEVEISEYSELLKP